MAAIDIQVGLQRAAAAKGIIEIDPEVAPLMYS